MLYYIHNMRAKIIYVSLRSSDTLMWKKNECVLEYSRIKTPKMLLYNIKG